MTNFDDNVISTPTIKEAAIIANMLDKLGAFEEAELIDEYIKKASETNGDIIKMAGFWSNIWDRMKGRTKRIFIKEFRQAHDSAMNVQEELDRIIEDISEKHKRIKNSLKIYQLADWYKELSSFPIGIELLKNSGFQETYGRFMQTILGVKEKYEESEKETSEVEKIFGPKTKEETEEKTTTKSSEDIGEWNPVFRRQPVVQEYYRGDRIRIQKLWWDIWAKHIKRVPNESGKIIFKVVPTAKDEKGEPTEKTPKNLEISMGSDLWEVEKKDSTYIYLKKFVPEKSKTEEKPKFTEEKAFERKPKLPQPKLEEEETPMEAPSVQSIPKFEGHLGEESTPEFEGHLGEESTPEFEGHLGEEKPKKHEKKTKEEEVRVPEEPKKTPEEEKVEAEKVAKELKEAMILGEKALEGTTWIRYNNNAKKNLRGIYRPVRKVRPEVHDVITDQNVINDLNKKWINAIKGKSSKLDDNFSGIRLDDKIAKLITRKRVCSECKKIFGSDEVEGNEDIISHGLCNECAIKQYKEIVKMLKNKIEQLKLEGKDLIARRFEKILKERKRKIKELEESLDYEKEYKSM